MIYEYSQLKGVIKVGDKVRAVPDKWNPCSELLDSGSNEAKITNVNDGGFSINHCPHSYSEGNFLELLEKTLDNLLEGDVIVDTDGDEYTVLGVCGKVILLSGRNKPNLSGYWRTPFELKDQGYKVKVPEPEV